MSLGPRVQRLYLVEAKEPLIFRTITDPENVRSYGGGGWNNSSQRSLWSSPVLPLSLQRNWSLPRSESETKRETKRTFTSNWELKLCGYGLISITEYFYLNMVRSKIIHECSSLSLETITVFLGQPACISLTIWLISCCFIKFQYNNSHSLPSVVVSQL